MKEVIFWIRRSVLGMILPRLGEKNMSVEVMSELAGFNRDTGYKIMNGRQRAA